MRVKQFINTQPQKGLKPIILRDVGRVIALIGKNGSGKTRIIDELLRYPNTLDEASMNDAFDFNMPYDLYLSRIPRNGPNAILLQAIRDNIFPRIKKIETGKYTSAVSPESTSNFEKLIKSNDIISLDINISSNLITSGMLSIVNALLKEDYLVYRKIKNENDTIFYKHFSRFRYWVEKLLDTQINYSDNGPSNIDATFNGTLTFNKFPYNFELLSPGQRVLLSFAFYFSLFEAKSNLNAHECIFIIDEPETHLHPDVQVKLIRALREIIKDNGQLWIATHSIHILAELNYDEIYLVQDGEVFPPNRYLPSIALAELMGVKDNMEKMNEFIASTTKWAETNFFIECLSNANIFLEPKAKDPEVEIFIKTILQSGRIDLLDFGAGKGRLATAIKEANDSIKSKIKSYSAFEPFQKDIEPIVRQLPISNNFFDQIENIGINAYNIVVFIGVIHEIDLSILVSSLTKAIEATKDNGALLIIEDLYFPKGELPNKKGYFVFNNSELEILFNQPKGSSTLIKSDNPRYSDRIEGSLFLRSRSLSVTVESLIKAVTQLRDRAIKNIKEFKENTNNTADGRRYAFYCQQYINCQIVLEPEESEKTTVPFLNEVAPQLEN